MQNAFWQTRLAMVVIMLICAAGSFHCDNQAKPTTDTRDSLLVYGPYRLVKLPITKGVNILNPIQLAKGPGGILFASNQNGEVFTLKDSDGDGLEDEAALYCDVKSLGLRSPAGFAHKGDTVYIGTSQEIRIFLDRNKDGAADTSWTFFKDIPYSQHPYEWTCGFNFGPDGWLYFNLTTDSWNAGASPDQKKYRGSILRISPDGKKLETLASGIRSVYGMAFNSHGDLFFTDNEGGGNPNEELNLLAKGAFYGHNPAKFDMPDSVTGPAHVLETEVAPAAITFNDPANDFGGTAGELFVAFYGPGERWKRGAVGRIAIQKTGNGYTFKESPVADIPKLSGLAFGRDGSLYLAYHGISDYWYNSVEEKSGGFYKLVFDPARRNQPLRKRVANTEEINKSSINAGRQLFAEKACLACHATDGTTELLGPNLKGIGKRLSREEIMEEIKFPSKIIKPSMGGLRIIKKDGQVLLGRAVNADGREISLMLIGNSIIHIPRNEIKKTENVSQSLMYENLLNDMNEEEVKSLVDFILSE